MRRPPRQLPTLNLHCSSLREPSLRIPFILSFALLLLTPLYNTQMVGNLPDIPEKDEKTNISQTITASVKPSDGFSFVESKVKKYESKFITSTLSKYQTLLNRFRRKRNVTTETFTKTITNPEPYSDSTHKKMNDTNFRNNFNKKEIDINVTVGEENIYELEIAKYNKNKSLSINSTNNSTQDVGNKSTNIMKILWNFNNANHSILSNNTVDKEDKLTKIEITVDASNKSNVRYNTNENLSGTKITNRKKIHVASTTNSSATTLNASKSAKYLNILTNYSTKKYNSTSNNVTNGHTENKITELGLSINTINNSAVSYDKNKSYTLNDTSINTKDNNLYYSNILTNVAYNESVTKDDAKIPTHDIKYVKENHVKDVLVTVVNNTNIKEFQDDGDIIKSDATFESNKTLFNKHNNSIFVLDTIIRNNAVNTRELLANDSMAKLKIDEATRKKIFHDYYTTVNKDPKGDLSKRKNSTLSIGDDMDGNEITVTTDVTDIAVEGEVKEHPFANESLAFPTDRFLHVPTNTNIYQSTRPSIIEDLPNRTTSRIVTILGLFELSVGDAPRAEGASELAAARLAINHVNQRTLLPGYKLHLITNDTKCDPGVGVDRFFHALYTERESRMVMLLGTACSEVTESIAKIVPYWNIVQVSFGSTSPALSDRSEFPLFCRTVAPDSSHNPARIAFIRQFGWDTVTAFSQNEEIYSLAVNELVTQLEAANITCAASITFAESDFKEQLQQLKKLDTRIIIGSFSQEMIPKIFCEAFKLGMFGAEYAWLVAGAPPRIRGAPPCSRAQLAKALEGLVSVTAHRGIVGDVVSFSGLTNDMFYREMQSSGLSVSPFAPHTYDAVWAIALALSKAELLWRSMDDKGNKASKLGLDHFDYNRKDMAEEFLYQLGNLSFLGISGPVSFNGADRIGMSAFYQIQGGRPKTVALYTHGREMLCPECSKPQWAGGIPAARRVLVMRVDSVSAPARLAVAALSAAGVALALSFLAFNLHYSKRRSIKLSSPRLNNMTLIGCVLVYTAVAMLGIDNSILPSYVPFSAMCTGRVYILSAGFSLAFGSMFAKTYRVHRIFVSNRSGVCKTKLLQDTPLISLVCALVVIDGMIVTLWTMLDPMERHLKNLTVEISTTDRSVVYQPQIEICKSQNTTGWLCALYAYKGLLLIVGVYMAWETRNVKISALNDSKYIGISVYSVVITSTSVVVIGTIISERATLAYITISSLILVATTSTLCLLFLPKIVAIRSKEEEDPVIQSMGLRLECKTRRFVTDETQELHFRIEIQNKVYKREVAALDKEIGRLEKLLAEPLEPPGGSIASIILPKRTELNTVEEEGLGRSDSDRRTPSITGGLPMLLLSVLPPVIPRASWPSAEACRGRNSVSFSSQPKLNFRKSQPSIDLYNLCLNKREENHGILKRLKSFFGSRPTSRKASTMSIADPTGQSIAAALKLHVGMIAGLVPGTRKHSMVLSCNTLNVPNPELKLRRESYARSGPIIRITDDEPTCSRYASDKSVSSGTQKYVAEPETKVNFVLPTTHKKPASQQSSCEKIKGSPRFPHRISPATSSLSTLDGRRKTSADSVFNITPGVYDEQRRFSHQNVSNQEQRSKVILESRWKSTEDARAGPSTRQ